ncbi:MAG TPA: polysulfide reductase, partial [Streptomyces sp.]|nr:polysulfide reductase [Streptomyces sp.]
MNGSDVTRDGSRGGRPGRDAAPEALQRTGGAGARRERERERGKGRGKGRGGRRG